MRSCKQKRRTCKRRGQRSARRQKGGAEYLALDCEMVEGPNRRSMVAEVAVVNWDGEVVYHTYVQPTGPVVDYRTAISGITQEKLVGAKPLWRVQEELLEVLAGHILVGHALENDLRALGLRYPRGQIRNTAYHPSFQTMGPRGQLQSRKLANLHLQHVGTPIQQGEHGAIEDARASMAVYRALHAEWNAPVLHEGPLFQRQTQNP